MILDYEGQCITSLPKRLNLSFPEARGLWRGSQPCFPWYGLGAQFEPTMSTNLLN